MELSDDDRMDMMERLSEVEANPDQQSILGKKTMGSRRRDDPAYRKIRHLCALWRRHREQPHLFSRELFQRDLETACTAFLQEDQDQQQQQQQQPQPQPQPQPQQPVTQGGGSDSNASHSSGAGGGTNNPARDNQSTRRRSCRFARVPIVASRASGESGGGGGGGSSSNSGSRRGRMVSPGQEEKDNDRSDDDDDNDMELGQNGGGGAGNGGSAGDGDGTVEATVKRVVDAHIEGGFLEPRRWKPTESFACPGKGYWTDKHGIALFRSSTDEDLRVARPAPAPEYIGGNPLCRGAPKHRYDKQRVMYYQCRKVAVSQHGEIFRATDQEIDTALKKETGEKKFLRTMKAGTYVKIICEARRRHRLLEEQDGAALVEPEEEEEEEEEEEDDDDDDDEDEGERNRGRGAESARAGKRVLRVPPGEEEQEEEEGSDSDDEQNDDDDNDTVIELDQNGVDGSGGGGSRVDVLDISDGDDEDEDDHEAEPYIRELVDRYDEAQGFLHRRLWKSLKPFKRPGKGYWRDEHEIVEFRTSTDADLAVARPAPAPVYIPNNPLSRKFPKGRFLKQRVLYHQCKKVAVSSDGKVFRATDEEIEAALNKEPENKKVLHGMKAGTYVKLIREARRRHRVFWEAEAEEADREEEEEDEEEDEEEIEGVEWTQPRKRARADGRF